MEEMALQTSWVLNLGKVMPQHEDELFPFGSLQFWSQVTAGLTSLEKVETNFIEFERSTAYV